MERRNKRENKPVFREKAKTVTYTIRRKLFSFFLNGERGDGLVERTESEN